MFKPIRKRSKHHGTEEEHVNLTALIDIVTILLFFLLLNGSESSVQFNIAKGIVLPTSRTKDPSIEGIMVQVSSDTIWVGNNKVADINEQNPNFYNANSNRINPLYDELVKEREKGATLKKATSSDQLDSPLRVNLMVDKSISYRFLKKVMASCAEAGYRQYKFVVLGND